MNLYIAPDWFCFIIPAIVIFLFTRTLSSQKTGGGFLPASSDRDEFWIVGIPLWIIISLASWAIYLKVSK